MLTDNTPFRQLSDPIHIADVGTQIIRPHLLVQHHRSNVGMLVRSRLSPSFITVVGTNPYETELRNGKSFNADDFHVIHPFLFIPSPLLYRLHLWPDGTFDAITPPLPSTKFVRNSENRHNRTKTTEIVNDQCMPQKMSVESGSIP